MAQPAVHAPATEAVVPDGPAPVGATSTLVLAAPDLAAALVLAVAVARVAVEDLPAAVALAMIVLVARRGAAAAWLGRDVVALGLEAARRSAARAATATGVATLAGGVAFVVGGGRVGAGSVGAVGVAAVAAMVAVLVPLEHQALVACGLRRQQRRAAGAAALATVVVGVGLLATGRPLLLVPTLALAAGDLVALALARHRPHGGSCGASGEDAAAPSAVEVAPRRPAAAAAAAVVWAMPLVVLLAPRSRGEGPLLAALAALSLMPLVAAGVVPTLAVPGLVTGRREALVPALVLGAALGGIGVLLAISTPGALGLADPRLSLYLPYAAAATAVLGLAHVVVHQRIGAGVASTALILVLIAAGLQVALTLAGAGVAADAALDAALASAGVLLVSLSVATAATAPISLTLTPEAAAEGPRLVGWALLGLTALAVVVRLPAPPRLWLDEAATARLAEAPFSAMLDAGLRVDAHPPLHLVLTWLSVRASGSGVLSLRLVSLLAGVLLVPLLYLTGKELYGRRTGLVAAAVAALAPASVWFSTQARPPAVAALLAAASLLATARVLRLGRWTDWALFAAAGVALLCSHQLAVLHLVVLHGAVAAAAFARSRSPGDIDGEVPPPPVSRAPWGLTAGAHLLALGVLVAVRSGLGPDRTLPPLEYATPAAPGGGTSVFSVVGSAVAALVGFHPPSVTARLLALWPLGILATLLVAGRARSRRGFLLLTLAIAPFVALFAAQLLGVPRRPAFALGWAATAVPAIALLAGRAVSALTGSWGRARVVAVVVGALLAVALADQQARARPEPRFDVNPVVAEVAEAGAGDVVLYEPEAIADLVRYEAGAADVRPLRDASAASVARYRRVYLVAAFSLTRGDDSVDRAVALVKELSSRRRLVEERGRPEVKVWVLQ